MSLFGFPPSFRFFLIAALATTAEGTETSVPGLPYHYVVFKKDAQGTPQPQSHRIVRLVAPRPSRSPEEYSSWLDEPPAGVERVGVRVLDRAGRVVHRDLVEVPRWVRTEVGLHGDHEVDQRAGGLVPGADLNPVPGQGAFVVRVPVRPHSRLELSLAHRGTGTASGISRLSAGYDLDALAARDDLPLSRAALEATVLAQPPPNSGNRVDMLIMGDGYTAAQSSKFSTDAGNLITSFFSISPYSAYRNFVNTATLFTASTQSGADHPPYDPSCPNGFSCCADTSALSDPLAGTFVSTAFDATFCAYNIHRLLVVDEAKALTAAAAVPDWDQIMLVVNDGTYGGSGGRLAVVSTHPLAVAVAQHEYGHSFIGLADEYATPYPGYPACSDVSGLPDCEPNVTDQTVRASIKWVPWIEALTPLPTPTNGYADKVGLFEGARYQSTGMYRPQLSCLMRSLGDSFCRICAQEYVRRLYQGGWGVPAGGIDTIEPGSEDPRPGPVVVAFPGGRTFSVGLLAPVGGPALSVTWLVDDVVQPGATGSSFHFSPPARGTYRIEVRTRDQTSLVHPAMAGTLLDSSRNWTATATDPADLMLEQSASAPEAVPGQPFTFTVTVQNGGPSSATGATVVDAPPSALTNVGWSCAASAGSTCTASGSGDVADSVSLLPDGTVNYTITGTVDPAARRQIVNTATVAAPAGTPDPDPANDSATMVVPILKDLSFHTLTPCRLVDTRNSAGPLGGPALVAGADRSFILTAGPCGIPDTAWAVSVNATITEATVLGHLSLYPGKTPLPTVSTLNYVAGQTRANNAIVFLGADGAVAVRLGQAAGTAHLVLDVNGYFDE